MKTLATSPRDLQLGWAWESGRAHYWRVRHQLTQAEKAESTARFYRRKLAEIDIAMPDPDSTFR